MDNIKIGQVYDYFDDGKISESRRRRVTVTDIIPLDKIDKNTFKLWIEEVKEFYWIYNQTTDYFIFGTIKGDNADDVDDIDVVFVRNLKNDWFSLGHFAGCLDSNGEFIKMLENRNG